MPAIDVIIPAYNARAVVGTAIDSVHAQTLRAARVIVVDDGSTDATADVVRAYGTGVTLCTQKNAGQGAARAAGMRLSDAEFVLFLDADDVLLPSALQDLAGTLTVDPDAGAVFGQALIWSGDSATPSLRPDHLMQELQDAGGDDWQRLLVANFIRTPGCVLMRSAALTAAGGWDGDRGLSGNEDWDLWLRLARQSRFLRLNRPTLWYRQLGNGYSADRSRMLASQRRLCAKHRRLSYTPAEARVVRKLLRAEQPQPRQITELLDIAAAAMRHRRVLTGGALFIRALRRCGGSLRRSITKRLTHARHSQR